MKTFFANYRSGTGISIRAAINALRNWRKAERAQTAARKKNVPRITPGWDYRPRESVPPHAAVEATRTEIAETLSSGPSRLDPNDLPWFDFPNPDPAVEDARTKAPWSDHAYAGSAYDQSLIDNRSPSLKVS